jgi:hypothetical protein
MQIHSVGIDLGKTTFHLVALGAAGKVLVKKKFTQRQSVVVHREHADIADRIGGLLRSPFSWPCVAPAGP